ncbi:hypothetical protein H0A73_22775, partial [Alcaligenaceae bacterium]|nr:hypothetical protein [Alcaligenaceae bacterium]
AISDIDNVTDVTVAQADLLRGASNYDDETYSLSDTWENLSNANNTATVEDADSYAISDIETANLTNLSVTLADLLRGASNYDDETYTVSDTWVNISDADNTETVEDADSYAISDIEAASLTDLSVALADLLRGASNYDGETYSLSDTWANISNADNAATVADADSYAISDIDNVTDVTVAQADLLRGASNYDDETYSLSDTWE